MNYLGHDLRYGLRMLVKKPSFAIIAFLTMALGIGANTAIFTVVNAVLLRPLPYPESERLMELGRAFPEEIGVSEVSEAKFIFLRNSLKSFQAIAAAQPMGSNLYLSDPDRTVYVSGVIVSSDFFTVLGVQPSQGRGFTKEEEAVAGDRVVIIGDGLWRRRFGSEAGVVGQRISINDAPYTVVGVMPKGFEFFGERDVLMPMHVNTANPNEGHNWSVIGRLQPDVSEAQARAELNVAFTKFRETYPKQVLKTENFGVGTWRANMTGGVQKLLWILFGAVGFVLLIACANVANLQVTRASSRQTEIAIRMALGGGHRRLIRQLITEGVVLALPGGAGGLLLSIWALGALRMFLPDGMIPRAREITLDWRVLAFCLAMSLLTGVVFGLAPVLQMLRVDIGEALKAGAGNLYLSRARGRLRNGLVVLEVALALALTVGAGLLLRTFANLKAVEPGFDSHNLLSVDIAPKARNYDTTSKTNELYDRAVERLQSLPGVESVAVTNKLPLDDKFNLPYRITGRSDAASAEYRLISPEYFRVMKMLVRQGRAFNIEDRNGSEPVAIVNEAFVRRNFAPDSSPLGQRLCVGCEWFALPTDLTIVGVVNDTKQRSLEEAGSPMVFVPRSQAPDKLVSNLRKSSLVLRTTIQPSQLDEAARHELLQIDPALPIRNVRSLDQLVGHSIAPQRFILSLLLLFAAIGLLLAAVGIYGVMAFTVSQRTHEIGLRIALGARAGDVLKLVIRQAMQLVLLGVVLGLFASVALTRIMKSLLFGVTATDPMTLAAVAALLTVVGLFACYLPARRATKVDPLVALRYE
ncbi:MAG TPA: ABC transporter permease [Pyrinomonadaceae bacterium]|nr:ABC transporter permease [Pyrinomonadaceae bacterium]